MRKIFLLLLLTTIVAIFTSCKEEDSLYYPGVSIYISDTDYYILDPGVSGDVTTSLPNLDFEVIIDDEVLTTFSTVDGMASYSFTQADLGNMETGDNVNVKFLTHVDGGPAAKYAKFSVKNPLVVEAPGDFYPAEDTTIYIKFKLADDCTAPTSLVITQQRNSDDPVTLPQPANIFDDSIAVALTNSMILDTLNFSFTFSNQNGTLIATHQLLLIIKRSWDFEEFESWSTSFAPWILEDLDGAIVYGINAFDYPGEGEAAAFRIFDFDELEDPDAAEGWEAYSGSKFAFAMAANPAPNNDWMSVDNFDIEDGYKLSFYAKSITDAYGLERLVVVIVDNADASETILTGDDTVEYSEVPTDWTNYEFDLTDWAGKNVKVKIGCVSNDAFAMFIDDFEIMTEDGKSVFKNSFEKPVSKPVIAKKVR